MNDHMSESIDKFIAEVDEWCREIGLARSTLSQMALRNRNAIDRLKPMASRHDEKIARVRRAMADYERRKRGEQQAG